ncbi:hypothetical protein I5M27_14225 [Adhaeribacter sp. BT258]|uniref:Uncharacterized protein n=1 Tax=Adhaeribacter terrigena TaxID=2793070 RepID=A0ABS1C635_9BACT|nr:hypothetical protein [Adhaeribacter terrigena]MBK0404148.1 hypothetical protein [Adhaeribacter terrigena]
MNANEYKTRIQQLLDENKFTEAATFIFDTYQEEHPTATSIPIYRDKVIYKLQTEFADDTPENRQRIKLLLYGFTTIIGHSEGEAAFNIILLLLHCLHKNQGESISEAIELIKLEKASNNLNIAS